VPNSFSCLLVVDAIQLPGTAKIWANNKKRGETEAEISETLLTTPRKFVENTYFSY